MTEDEVNEAIDDIKENVKNDIDDALFGNQQHGLSAQL